MKEKLRQAWERAGAVTRDIVSGGLAILSFAVAFGVILILSLGITVLKFVFVQPTERLLTLASFFPFRMAPRHGLPFLRHKHA